MPQGPSGCFAQKVTDTFARVGPPVDRLLEFLLRRQGTVVSRTAILEHVWGLNSDPFTNVVDVFVNRLRNKMDYPFGTPLIHTVRGVGYMMIDREDGS